MDRRDFFKKAACLVASFATGLRAEPVRKLKAHWEEKAIIAWTPDDRYEFTITSTPIHCTVRKLRIKVLPATLESRSMFDEFDDKELL